MGDVHMVAGYSLEDHEVNIENSYKKTKLDAESKLRGDELRYKCGNCERYSIEVKEYFDVSGDPKDINVYLCSSCAKQFGLFKKGGN